MAAMGILSMGPWSMDKIFTAFQVGEEIRFLCCFPHRNTMENPPWNQRKNQPKSVRDQSYHLIPCQRLSRLSMLNVFDHLTPKGCWIRTKTRFIASRGLNLHCLHVLIVEQSSLLQDQIRGGSIFDLHLAKKTTKLAGLRLPGDVSCKAGWGFAKHQTSQVHHEASRLSSSACAIKCDVPVPFVLRWSETIYKPQDFQNTAKHISESYLHLQSVCFASQSSLRLASLRIEVPHWCLQQDRKELAALHDVANQVCSVLVVFSCFQPDLLHLSSSSLKKIRIVRVGSTIDRHNSPESHYSGLLFAQLLALLPAICTNCHAIVPIFWTIPGTAWLLSAKGWSLKCSWTTALPTRVDLWIKHHRSCPFHANYMVHTPRSK